MKREDFFAAFTVKRIKDLLVTDPTVISSTKTVADLLPMFNMDLRTRHIYVIDDRSQTLIGVVRMNDIVKYLFPATAIQEQGIGSLGTFGINLLMGPIGPFGDENPYTRSVVDVMNEEVQAVHEDTPLCEMAAIMMRETINELPVVDTDDHLIGQVNVYEVIEFFTSQMPTYFSEDR